MREETFKDLNAALTEMNRVAVPNCKTFLNTMVIPLEVVNNLIRKTWNSRQKENRVAYIGEEDFLEMVTNYLVDNDYIINPEDIIVNTSSNDITWPIRVVFEYK